MPDYHAFTKGLENLLLFRDTEDYIDGMNGIPVVLQKAGCYLLAACLMSNHVHFVLNGDYGGVLYFMGEYKRRLSMALREKYGEIKALRGLNIAVKEIDSNDYLKTVIAYVLRNPTAAGYKGMLYDYKWSTAKCYFDPEPERGTKLASLSMNRYRKTLKTKAPRTEFLGSCEIDKQGMILPSSYVDFERVKGIYGGRPSSLLFHLSKNDDDRVEVDMGRDVFESQDDSTIRRLLVETCGGIFGTMDVNAISYADKMALARIVRRRFGATNKQLTRIMRVKIGKPAMPLSKG